MTTQTEIERLEARMAAVEALHVPVVSMSRKVRICDHDGDIWPCATARALAVGDGGDGTPSLLDGSVVVDNQGDAWTITHDGGMVTRAHYSGVQSAGLSWLEAQHGPLQVVYRHCRPECLLVATHDGPCVPPEDPAVD